MIYLVTSAAYAHFVELRGELAAHVYGTFADVDFAQFAS